MKFKKGDRVICANHDGIDPKWVGVWYPKIGTLGTKLGGNLVRWDEGTEQDNVWNISDENLALAKEYCQAPVEYDPSDIDDLLGSIYKENKE